MKNSESIETSSRRQFTRAIVTAAVAAPIAASMVSCGRGPSEPPPPSTSPTATTGLSTTPCACSPVEKSGYTEIPFIIEGGPEEHIPPMRIDGGGSLVIDSRNKLKTGDTGSGPFTYDEEDPITNSKRYGVIRQVVVIEELVDPPFLTVTLYGGFSSPGTGTQLWLWYQNISASPEDPDDTTYPAVTFPDDPDVRVIGGKGADKFKLVVKNKKLDGGKSHKPKKPNRYTHSDGGLLARHFRIGKWRLVDSAGATLIEKSGAENYAFHLLYSHYQPPL